MSRSEWKPATPSRRCKVCKSPKRCAISDDGAVAKCTYVFDGPNVFKGGDDEVGQWAMHRLDGSAPADAARYQRHTRDAEPDPALADVPTRHAVYTALLAACPLSAEHREGLLHRGLTAEDIAARGYGTLPLGAGPRARIVAQVRGILGADAATDPATAIPEGVPGLHEGRLPEGLAGTLVPVRDTGGSIIAMKVRRDGARDPRYLWLSSKGIGGASSHSPAHVPAGAEQHVAAARINSTTGARPEVVVRITEGELKADVAFVLSGIPTVSIPGAGAWKSAIEPVRALSPDVLRLAWDADARTNEHVADALERAALHYTQELPGVAIELETWEPAAGKGIDDAILAGAPANLHRGVALWHEIIAILNAAGVDPRAETVAHAGVVAVPSVDHAPPAPPTAPPAPAAPGAAADPNDPRPRIVVESRVSDRVSAYTRRTPTTDLARAGLAALAQTLWGDRIFALEGSNPPCMVHVVAESADAEHGHLARASVVGTTKSVLRGWMSGAARWIFEGGGRSGNETVEADPPESVVCFARESCEGVRPLRGLVEAPVMRRDGTIIATPGYDPATRLFAAFDADAAARALAAIPDAPTQADARAALDILHKLVCDFPFEKTSHRATWVAGLLTMLAREMFDGPAPLFLARANTRGSGKTLLTELPHIIACGDRPAMLGWSGDEQEFEKQVTTEAIAGSSCVVIDNITGTFKSATLDRILTSGKHRARILGGNQKFDGPMRAVWWGSGNNLDTSDDMASRRIAPIELIATDARPEDRTGFAADSVEGDAAHGGSGETGTAALRALALRRRWEYVAAAMTILRAWHCAGRPDGGLPAWGSFESWSRVVRGALVFAGDVDPGDAHIEFRDSASVDTAQLRGLLEGWMDAVDTKLVSPSGEPLKRVVDRIVAEARDAAQRKETPRGVMLREALEGITSETLEKWSSKTAGFIGKWLRSRKAKVATTDRGPRAFDVAGESGGSARWQIVQPAAPIGRTDEAADDHGRGERGVEGDTIHRSALTCVHARDLSPLRPCMRIEPVGDIPPNTPLPPATSPSDGVRNGRTGQTVPMSFDDGDMVPDDTTPPEHGFGDGEEGA